MSCTNPDTEFEALVYLADRLQFLFPEVGEDTVFALIAEELESFDGARLRDYVPVLVEHNVLRRLSTGGVVSGGCGLQPSLRIPFHETVPLVNGGVRSSAAGPYPGRMVVGREEFGPIRVVWADAAASALPSLRMPRILGEQQARRCASLSGVRAQRFLAGRWLLAELIAELTDETDLGFTTTCQRCGADHGRPRLEGAPVAVSVSYAGSMVAVAASRREDAAEVGVDIEREPGGSAHSRLDDLAPLFAPAAAPDTQGWTLVEAALKADGRGVSVDLAEVHVCEVGTGRWPGARAVRIPGRLDSVDAAVIVGPSGFVLSAAMVPAARERHPE